MSHSADKNIIVWGDSILKGVVFDENDGKYKVIKDNSISSFAQITGFNVKNNAYFGMTSTKALNRISKSIDKMITDKENIVIIEFGGNDCDFNWREIAENPDLPHQPKTSIESFKSTLQNMIDMFRKKGVTPVLMNLPPLEPERYFNWVSKGLNRDNILHWLGDVARIYRWQEAYNNAVEWVSRQMSCKMIDIREGFLLSKNYSSQICTDGMHPNEKGHKKILESMLEFNF
ncbi:SGNH/GDSL hydrolase family protein [Ruminiclostridium josui]|uniref:SGNH/GDSL hydrolase family protein n=1 Tax=Ruminiclostridium josui TaxID=1499 RepID=UPI000462EC3C|nr:SGNH/GDSL hydrolase family protein [Ruminiclostridium josui]